MALNSVVTPETVVGRSIIKLSNFAKRGQLTLDTTDYYTLGYHRINNSPKQSRTFLRGGTMATQVMITHSTAAVLIYYFQTESEKLISVNTASNVESVGLQAYIPIFISFSASNR